MTNPARLRNLAVSTQAKRRDDGFEGPTGTRLRTDDPLLLAALERAAEAWPAAVWVRDLAAPDSGGVSLCEALLRAYVALHVHPPPLTTTPGDTPSTTALVRHQAGVGDVVTNLRHTSVRIEDDLGRRLLTLLDGTRDRAALIAELRDVALSEDQLRDGLERSLQGLGRLALLQG